MTTYKIKREDGSVHTRRAFKDSIVSLLMKLGYDDKTMMAKLKRNGSITVNDDVGTVTIETE